MEELLISQNPSFSTRKHTAHSQKRKTSIKQINYITTRDINAYVECFARFFLPPNNKKRGFRCACVVVYILCYCCLSFGNLRWLKFSFRSLFCEWTSRKKLGNKRSKFEIEVEIFLWKTCIFNFTTAAHTQCSFILAFLSARAEECNVISSNVYIYCASRLLYVDVHMKFACSRFITIVIVFLQSFFLTATHGLLSSGGIWANLEIFLR
jgi:hypothetical protein